MTDPSLPIIVTACSQRYLIPNKKKEKRRKMRKEKLEKEKCTFSFQRVNIELVIMPRVYIESAREIKQYQTW